MFFNVDQLPQSVTGNTNPADMRRMIKELSEKHAQMFLQLPKDEQDAWRNNHSRQANKRAFVLAELDRIWDEAEALYFSVVPDGPAHTALFEAVRSYPRLLFCAHRTTRLA